MNKLFRFRKNIIVEISLITTAAFSIYFGKIDIFILIFSIVVHELGHIIAATLIGARAENFIIHGFGVELIFPGKTLTPNKTLILAAGGPVASIILALCAISFEKNLLYITNISIAMINLLPVAPLDGGNIIGAILSSHLPRKTVRKFSRICGKFLGFTITLCGIPVLIISNFNISLIYLGLFIFFSSDRLQNPVTEITAANYSKTEKCSIFLIDENSTLIEAASYLPINSIGAIRNSNGEITSLVTSFQLYHIASDINISPNIQVSKIKTRLDTSLRDGTLVTKEY